MELKSGSAGLIGCAMAPRFELNALRISCWPVVGAFTRIEVVLVTFMIQLSDLFNNQNKEENSANQFTPFWILRLWRTWNVDQLITV